MLLSVFASIVVLLVIAATGLGLVYLFDWVRFRSMQNRRVAVQEQERRRLFNPKFKEIEEFFASPLPLDLRRLYESKKLIVRCDFTVRVDNDLECYISHFLPCDVEAAMKIGEALPACKRLFSFASDGGDIVYLINPTLEDPPVMIYDAEDNEIVEVASHFSKFIQYIDIQS
jgi:hypothetical protein